MTYRDNIDLKLTWIPEDAPRDPGTELFDPQYMSALFEFGRLQMVDDSAWTRVTIDSIAPSNEY